GSFLPHGVYIYLITSCFVPPHFTSSGFYFLSVAVEVHALPLLVYLMVPLTTSISTALSNLGQNAFLYFLGVAYRAHHQNFANLCCFLHQSFI
ncbi:hypothetical protein BDP27DRAFT_1322067, partial [Rhodocollybia butyracea]